MHGNGVERPCLGDEVMRELSPSDNGQMHRTALKLVRCLGHKAAADYCLNNQWLGLYEEIQALDRQSPAERK